jgi:hypothetical protein
MFLLTTLYFKLMVCKDLNGPFGKNPPPENRKEGGTFFFLAQGKATGIQICP